MHDLPEQEPGELATAAVEVVAGVLGWGLFLLSLNVIMGQKPHTPDEALNIGEGMRGLFILIPTQFIGALFFGRAGGCLLRRDRPGAARWAAGYTALCTAALWALWRFC